MDTFLFTHPACLNHDTGPYHPECADRLRVVMAALEAEEFALLHRFEAPRADVSQLERAHRPAYVHQIFESIPPQGHRSLDPDTVISPGSGEAALRAAGAVVAAVDAVVAREARTAFCAVRPPGHHAEPGRAMGFCLFNNAAIGAIHAKVAHGLERIAVVDFDVHHGNGTQRMCEGHSFLFYASTHEYPLYPGTGAESERGVFDNVVNVPLKAHSGSTEFRAGVTQRILPALAAFDPDLIIVSAGFDAHVDDPMAGLRLHTEDFAWVSRELVKVADACCAGRIVSTLEGGYDLNALSKCVAAHVRALMGG